ncbi:MAG: DUF4157 domain-containing protein [Ferruginibacter sp.]|nr:DUF4157 domain-containing protein [Ferruginibacter sp.]
MRSSSIAMVLGNTIHLYNISLEDFLQDERLVKHELCHVRQYQQHGFIGFLTRYLWECYRKGYYANKFEVEARETEELDTDCKNCFF